MSMPKRKLLATAILGVHGTVSTLCAADVVPKGYMSLDGGVTRTQDTVVHDGLGHSTPVAFDSGLRFDLRLGVRSPVGFGAEIDLGVLYNQLKTNPLFPSGGKLDLYQVPILLNVFYSFRVLGPLRVQLGGGIGAVYGVFSGDGTSLIDVSSDVSFGYQGFGQISYALNERLDIGVAYKYLGTTSHDWGSGIKMDGTHTHALMAALTIKF